MKYYSWVGSGRPPGPPYNYFSPNLNEYAKYMRANYGARGGSGFNVRPIRGGEPGQWSAHAYGAAWDSSFKSAAQRERAIAVTIENHLRWGIQAIHDYANSRIWRVGVGWKKSTISGMGVQQHLHVETTPNMWALDTPITARGSGATSTVTPASDVTTSGEPVLRRTQARSTDLAVVAAVKRVQAIVGVAQDGWFGAATDRAVRAYQRTHGLYVDGIVGKNTWRTINANS